MKDFFVYKQIPLEETRKLAELEPRLAELINFDKSFNIRLMPDHFQCLIHTVISQQASNAAVDTIWNKLVFSFKKISAKTMAAATSEQLNAIGLSPNKISAIKKISYDIVDHKLNLKKLGKQNDEVIRQTLTQYKYIGNWTVDMMLIFSYYRNNVFPINDFGVQQGLKKLFGDKTVDQPFIDEITHKFNNYLTLLTFCLWRIK